MVFPPTWHHRLELWLTYLQLRKELLINLHIFKCVLSFSLCAHLLGYMFPEPGGPMYRRPPPPPGALGLLPPPGSLPPGPLHPRGLPPGPPHPADMAGESLRSVYSCLSFLHYVLIYTVLLSLILLDCKLVNLNLHILKWKSRMQTFVNIWTCVGMQTRNKKHT